MANTPFPPLIRRILPPKIGAGMDDGKTVRTGNTVWHTMVGTLDGTDAYFRLAWVHAATTWGIGGSLDGSKDGVIYQWMDVPGLVPWASGKWNPPGYEDGQKYVNEFGIFGINGKADSIEFSGMVETPMTMLQWKNGIWLTAAIIHAGGRDSEQFLWNMHHREFTTPPVKDCPFARIYRYTVEYQKGIVYTLQHYEGKNVPESVQIAGIHVPLALNKKPSKPPPDPKKPIFVPFDKPHRATLNKGATYRQYGNTDAKIYNVAESEQREEFDGYYHGQMVNGSDRWFVTDNPLHERIHESGIKSWIDPIPQEIKK